ncbi:hypothetical protein H4S14_001975 [Agrobacterium vitis]|nr:hypothetical protein [Agrobacterium vitis]MBE1438230.1 hypothetical protein [Agrobacterium vitis]
MMDFIGLLAAQQTFKRYQRTQTEDAFYQFYAQPCFPNARRVIALLSIYSGFWLCNLSPKSHRA